MANAMVAFVVGGQNELPSGAAALASGTADGQVSAPAVTMLNNNGKSLLFHLFGQNALADGFTTPPTGYTNRAHSNYVCADTKDDTTTDGAITRVAYSGSHTYHGGTIEILPDSYEWIVPEGISFDSVGPGAINAGSGLATYITHHSGTYVIVAVASDRAAGVPTAVTLGQYPMDFLYSTKWVPGVDAGARITLWGLKNAPGGTLPVVMTGGAQWVSLNAISYYNVVEVKMRYEQPGAVGTTPSATVPAPITDGKWLQVFGSGGSSFSNITGGTDRYSPDAFTYSAVGLAESDSATTFSGTGTYGYGWGGATLELAPYITAEAWFRTVGPGFVGGPGGKNQAPASGSFLLGSQTGDYIIVDISGDDWGTAISYDGVPLTLLASYQFGTNTPNVQLPSFQRYGGFVAEGHGGMKTLAWVGSSPAGTVSVNATVYGGVTGIGETTHAYGTGGTPSISPTCDTGELIAVGFGANQSGAVWVPAGGNNRVTSGTVSPLTMMDGTSGTYTVTATGIGTWNALATVLEVQALLVENITRVNQPVPEGVSGCYVTLVGGGAAGHSGTSGTGAAEPGGPGGGGGARIDRVFIPISLLDSTYSCSFGAGGFTTNTDGSASVFSSGSLLLSAGGGICGGAGGVASTSGAEELTISMFNGSAGGAQQTVGVSNTENAGAGGGGGAPYVGWANGGAVGGNSTTVTGGAAQTAAADAAIVPDGGAGGGGGNGGNAYAGGGWGGNGGKYGGGGGGGAGANGAAAGQGGRGGDGYLLIEWVEE